MNTNMYITLDPRLAAAAEMVRNGSVAADIGTDHGRLIAWLAASGKCPRGYACDIAPEPLSHAERLIKAAGLSDRIEMLLGDGLEKLAGKGAEDIIILGMGGDLIAQIILSCGWTRDKNLRFVLQPMTKAERLRAALLGGGFEILREKAVVSGRFVYSVISAAYSGNPREADGLFAWTGMLWNDSGEAARRYLTRTLRIIERKARGFRVSGAENEAARLYEIADEIKIRIC